MSASSRPPSSSSTFSSSAAPPGAMSTARGTAHEEEAAAAGCLPADQSCFALSGRSPFTTPRRIAAARACCTTTSYVVVLGISFGSLLAILLVLCVIRWWLVQRSARRHEEEDAAAADAATGLAKIRAPGLDADAIAVLPEFVYRKDEHGGGGNEDEEECAVCLAAMAEGEAARRLPRCMHMFHRNCVDVWLRERSTCPVCRARVVVVVRPAGGECAEKEIEGSTSQSALASPPRPPPPPPPVDGDERDLEAQWNESTDP